jgi:hypothetical protein
MWRRISSATGRDLGNTFESIGTCWLSNKKFATISILSSAALWALWKLRNALCFQNSTWQNMGKLLMNIVVMAQNWIICVLWKKGRVGRLHKRDDLAGKKVRNVEELHVHEVVDEPTPRVGGFYTQERCR